MFGKRGPEGPARSTKLEPVAPAVSMQVATASEPRSPATDTLEPGQSPVTRQVTTGAPLSQKKRARTEDYYNTKSQVFSALIDTIDLSQLAKLDAESAREEIRDIVNDIITIDRKSVV